jgi:gliding motility-associated-like protein
MIKSILYTLALCGGLSASSQAQLINSGDAITLSNNSLLFVSGDFINQKGTISNKGKLEVQGVFANNDLTSGVFDNSSTGEVSLSGTNTNQEITGSRIAFPSLSISNGDKSLKTDIDVAGILSLGNRRLDAGDYNIHITNGDNNAIQRGENVLAGTGFITTENGFLIRNTNSDLPYLFPLGSGVSNPNLLGVATLYRPLNFTPENSFENTFSASLINKDPTNSGFDMSKKRYDVKEVSNKYYYLLGQKAGTSKFGVTFYQNSSVDNNFTQLVTWGDYLQWEKAAKSTVSTGAYDDGINADVLNTSVQYNSIKPFEDAPFTFSSEIGGVNPFTFFNAFSPDGDNKNDVWMINNIELYPDNKLTIYNRWGDEVFSTKGYTNEKAWDGGNLQSGTYYYVLTATIENQPRVFKGFITMIKKN